MSGSQVHETPGFHIFSLFSPPIRDSDPPPPSPLSASLSATHPPPSSLSHTQFLAFVGTHTNTHAHTLSALSHTYLTCSLRYT